MIGVRVRVDGDAPVFLIPVGRLEEVGQQGPELLPRLSGEGEAVAIAVVHLGHGGGSWTEELPLAGNFGQVL